MKYDIRTIDTPTPSDEIKTSRLLNLYREILEGKEVQWNSSNDDHLDLQLSGLVSNQKEYLLPISPIHKKVFDLAWTDECLSKIIPIWYREKLRGWTLSNSDVSKRDRYYLLYGEELQEAKEKYGVGKDDQSFINKSERCLNSSKDNLMHRKLINLLEPQKETIVNRMIYWTSSDRDIFNILIEQVNSDDSNPLNPWPDALPLDIKEEELESLVNTLVEDVIRKWKEKDIFTTIHYKVCQIKNEDNYLNLLITYGKILDKFSEIPLVFAEGDPHQKTLLEDIKLIKKRYSLSQNNYYLEVANPIYRHIFNLYENDFKLYENEFNKSYIGMMLPDRRGYGKKLGMWLITQNQKYLLLAEELEIIISHLGNQQLSDEEHEFLVKSQIRTSNSGSEFLEQRLVQLVIDMQKNKKAINPQMMLKKIFEQIKPKYVKCIAIICNLLDQHNNFINEGEEEKIINEVVEKFSDRWQENEEGQHLQEIRDQIINHERSLYLLLLYQQILTENDQVNPTYINSNDLEYLMGLDLVVSEEELKVSNKLYKEVFDSSFVTQEIENKINSLVKSQWQFNNELKEETKQEVTDLITKTSILLPLSTKTNNLERLISLILEWSKPDHTLLKLLVNSITESQGRILLNDNNQEARKSFNNFVRMHLTDNWQENSSVDATINPRNIVKSTIMPTEKMIDQPINPEISIDVLLERIMSKAESYLKAIIVVNLQHGEVVENNYNEDELDKSVYKQVIGKGSGGVAIEDFDTFIPHIKALQKFSEERDVGELDYSIYAFTQGLVIGAFLDIEGTFYGIFYIAKSGVSRGKLINMCEQTIPQIKKAFQQDQDFTVM
ncbi:MAG: hypothetical protein MGF17_02930 [Trichodesmium sp. MAG_R04]|nr:hypothetical protein [Trichodesmium sp. MAG_R04]